MNTRAIKESWCELLLRLKQRFVFLTDNDLRFNEDNKEEMFEDLRIKLGKTKQELQKIITEF
jgi:hypothetical protein